MQSFDELRREAEETKERLRRDVLELHDILKRIAREGGEHGRAIAEESLRQAETRIEEAVSQAETRLESALAAVTGCNLSYEDFITRNLSFTDFTSIEVDCAFRVEVTRSEQYKVSVWASEELQDYVSAVKSGNTLKLSLKSGSYHARPVVNIKISMPQLSKLRLGAATKGTVRGFVSRENLDLNLSGNCSLDVEMTAGAIKCEISGASRLTGKMQVIDAEFVLSGASRTALSGQAERATVSAWGASQVEMNRFPVKDASLHLKGASEAAIAATGMLDIDLSSGSRLTYTGNPTIRSISVTGASSLDSR
ncbi:MAG: DUF2807 domain-containing protein [Dehalococcoidia bacterium]|nr:DUF2807 domain-containing protein [Dehalococcoidia bacterium]